MNFPIQAEVWRNVLMLKEFTMSHLLLLICPNNRRQSDAKDEVDSLVREGYLSQDGDLYKLTSDMDKRFDLLEKTRCAEERFGVV